MTKSCHLKHVTKKLQQNSFSVPSPLDLSFTLPPVPYDAMAQLCNSQSRLRHEGVALKPCTEGIYEPEQFVLGWGHEGKGCLWGSGCAVQLVCT